MSQVGENCASQPPQKGSHYSEKYTITQTSYILHKLTQTGLIDTIMPKSNLHVLIKGECPLTPYFTCTGKEDYCGPLLLPGQEKERTKG